MDVKIITICGLSLLASISTAGSKPSSGLIDAEKMPEVTVCQLEMHRKLPPIGRVRIKATAWIMLRKGSMLVDENCPNQEIEFNYSDNLLPNSGVPEFYREIIGDPMKIGIRKFDVDVAGTYVAATTATPHGLFYIDHVYSYKRHQPTTGKQK